MAPVRLDLHTHSRHSPDSWLPVETIVRGAAAAGMNGIALTDHDSVVGHAELLALREKFPSLILLPGVEVSTREGHLLALGVSAVPPLYRPVEETIGWVRDHGGVSVVPHPFRRIHGVGREVVEGVRADAIEVVNGHNSARANRKAAEVADRRKIGTTGGGDVHQTQDIGRVWTEFPDGVLDVRTALDAIRQGRTRGFGKSLTGLGRVRYALRTFALRARRGFRRI